LIKKKKKKEKLYMSIFLFQLIFLKKKKKKKIWNSVGLEDSKIRYLDINEQTFKAESSSSIFNLELQIKKHNQ
jgi:hypothetical protein